VEASCHQASLTYQEAIRGILAIQMNETATRNLIHESRSAKHFKCSEKGNLAVTGDRGIARLVDHGVARPECHDFAQVLSLRAEGNVNLIAHVYQLFRLLTASSSKNLYFQDSVVSSVLYAMYRLTRKPEEAEELLRIRRLFKLSFLVVAQIREELAR